MLLVMVDVVVVVVLPVRRRSCNLELLSFPFTVSSSSPCLPCVAASTTHATDVQLHNVDDDDVHDVEDTEQYNIMPLYSVICVRIFLYVYLCLSPSSSSRSTTSNSSSPL